VELGVWKAIQEALPAVPRPPMPEETAARLTEAVYQVALERGFSGSFVDLELSLWDAFSHCSRRMQTV
jgi:hypothetical protein